MHVVRRIGATPSTTLYQSSTPVSRFDAPKTTYYAPTPGDVQVRQTAVPTTPTASRPPSTSTTPTQTPNETCAALWTALMAQTPDYLKACLRNPLHRAAYNKICLLTAGNQISPATGAAQWSAYLANNCGNYGPPTAQPPPPPTSTPTVPPELVEEPPSVMDDPTGGPGGDSGGAPGSGEEPWQLRQVGSIVGIGLIVAVGLTYARKKGMLKLTKRRRRR